MVLLILDFSYCFADFSRYSVCFNSNLTLVILQQISVMSFIIHTCACLNVLDNFFWRNCILRFFPPAPTRSFQSTQMTYILVFIKTKRRSFPVARLKSHQTGIGPVGWRSRVRIMTQPKHESAFKISSNIMGTFFKRH